MPNDAIRGGFDRFHREADPARQARYRFFQEIQQMIPPDASIAATGRLGAHIVSRSRAYTLARAGDADHLVLWSGDLRQKTKARITALHRAGRHEELRHGHGIRVFKRRAAPEGGQ